MAVKTYGTLSFDPDTLEWRMGDVKPHVSIKLKSLFPRIPKSQPSPYFIPHTLENCHDLLWFLDRYPMDIDPIQEELLKAGRREYIANGVRLEAIMMPDYTPPAPQLRNGYTARDYQLRAAAFDALQRRFLLGDDVGLGKTLEGILTLLTPGKLPAIVVVQAHLPKQWKAEGIEKFTDLKVHIVKKTIPYDLPPADVYITTYSKLSGWVDVFATGFFKSAIFDEIQELRRPESQKYKAGCVLSESVQNCMGMSATPIYNYGDEIFNVLNLIKPGCLGEKWDFLREWAAPIGADKWRVIDPAALGSYLRDSHLMLRRTRKEVGRELPPINKIIQTVGYDHKEAMKADDMARQLALKVVSGGFVERGQAARELDALLRHKTGVSKAREVAAFTRILLENDEPVMLAGWHRDLYDIWREELAEFNPVMYTGSETNAQKDEAKRMFLSGESGVFIISLRSGIGLDGLQARCRTVVVGELDWSPKVHDQVIGRIDRDGQEDQVTAYFLVCDYGSDPAMIDVLGLKSSQSHGILNPLEAIPAQFSDESRIKILAQSFLAIGKDGNLHTKLKTDE
jgi:SNF2 family DNA or RNA helicase